MFDGNTDLQVGPSNISSDADSLNPNKDVMSRNHTWEMVLVEKVGR